MPYLWVRKLNNIKISVLPKLMYRSNIILIKITVDLFVEIELFKNFLSKCKEPRIVQMTLKKKKKELHYLISRFTIKLHNLGSTCMVLAYRQTEPYNNPYMVNQFSRKVPM